MQAVTYAVSGLKTVIAHLGRALTRHAARNGPCKRPAALVFASPLKMLSITALFGSPGGTLAASVCAMRRVIQGSLHAT